MLHEIVLTDVEANFLLRLLDGEKVKKGGIEREIIGTRIRIMMDQAKKCEICSKRRRDCDCNL